MTQRLICASKPPLSASATEICLVPWIDWREWNQVYAFLLQEHHQVSWRFCLNIIRTWQSRGCVPVAVESTANLLEMLLSDSSPSLLRLSMSMTIVRVVNGFVDQHRQNDSFARSISQIAHEIAMPQRFVELRHEATHNRLPPFHHLREACRDMLSWVVARYWQPQHDRLNVHQHDFKMSMMVFKQAAKALSKGANYDGDVAGVVKEALGVVCRDPKSIVEWLVHDESSTIIRVPRTGTELTDTNLERVFRALEKSWSPLLDAMSESVPDLYESLLLSFTLKVTSTPVSDGAPNWLQALASRWSCHCLQRCGKPGNSHVLAAVLEACLLQPSSHSLRILSTLHSQLQGSRLSDRRTKVANAALEMAKAIQDTPSDSQLQHPSELVQCITNAEERMDLRKQHVWNPVLYSMALPVGALPNGKIPELLPRLNQEPLVFGANVVVAASHVEMVQQPSTATSHKRERPVDSLLTLQEAVRPFR